MKTATLKNITLDKEKRQIIITIDAKDSFFIQEPIDYGFPNLVNSAVLTNGLPFLLEQGHHAVDLLKGNKLFTDLIAENKRLKSILLKIASFENGNKVELDGLHYQKSINENSFYNAISTETK